MKLIDRCIRAKKAVEKHSDFKDKPWERVSSLLLQIVSDRTLPNVMIGAAATAQINYMAGVAPQSVRNLSVLALLLSIGLFAIGDEVKYSLKALKEEMNQPEDSDKGYQ